MPPCKVELIFLHGISLDFNSSFHVYMQRYSFSPFNNAVRCIIQEGGNRCFQKHFDSIRLWSLMFLGILRRGGEHGWYARRISPLTHRELDVPAEPGAASAWLRPPDIAHHSFVAGILCPSSSPSLRCIWCTFEGRGSAPRDSSPYWAELSAWEQALLLVKWCLHLFWFSR